MLSHSDLRDDSDSGFDDENDTPHIKKPWSPKVVAQRLKLLDAEIELIRSGESLDDRPAYGVLRGVDGFDIQASSFIKRVPEEILSEIFMACVPHWGDRVKYHRGYDGPNTMDRTQAPWVLTQVCSEWRSIVLSLSWVWNRIIICPDLVHSELKIKIILLSVEISLLRSANTPLFVWVQADERSSIKHFEKPWGAVLDALMRHSERWQDVIITLEPTQIRQLSKIKGRVPSLRRLKMKILHGRDQNIGTLDMFSLAPALYRFEIVGNGSVSPVGPWSQLTHYGGKSYVAETQIELLCEMSSLTHALFDLRQAYRSTSFTSHCTHMCLRSLSIHGTPFVLDGLTLPALQTLLVTSTRLLTPIVPFIQRSSCTLTNLTLGPLGRTVGGTDMIAIFKATPALTSLSLTCSSDAMTGNDISRLTFNSSNTESCLLPQLRKLDFKPSSIDPERADQLIEMIESRWKVQPSFPAGRIHSVRLQIFYRNVETNLPYGVERLREEGLDISIQRYL